MVIRKAAVAGTFYPRYKPDLINKLKDLIEGLLIKKSILLDVLTKSTLILRVLFVQCLLQFRIRV